MKCLYPSGRDAAAPVQTQAVTEGNDGRARLRREPPRFRRVRVVRVEPVTARLTRVTFGGDELDGFTVEQPAASVRVLLPRPGATDLVMPAWNGNEFLLADGSRPVIRTFTPLRADAVARTLDVEIVLHGGGAASTWATAARPGAPAAISGPGRGYEVDAAAGSYLLAGDETAIPAISQLLGTIPATTPVVVHVEVAEPAARTALQMHPKASVTWHDRPPGAAPGDTLVAAVRASDVDGTTRVWVAGEAAAVQRIRRHLFDDRAVPRSHTSVRGYWKAGRAGDEA
jgi:NADPH-dependent ferric siderophore reductase